MPRRVAMALAILLPVLMSIQGLSASARDDRAGKVHIGNGDWVFPAEAVRRGFFEYHRRWFPAKMRKKLAKWERQDARHAEWRRARRISTKHYRIITNVPRFIVEYEIRPFLDALYSEYAKVFKERFGLKSKAANQKCIHIHHGYDDYAEVNREGSRPQPRSSPGFIIGGATLVTYYDDAEPEMFYGTVFHEGAHQFVQAVLPGAVFPMWIDEALATYFEGCTYSLSRRTVAVDFLPPTRLLLAQRLLREKRPDGGPVWDLFDVLNAPDAEFDARYYALSWSFVYYMTHAEAGRYRKRFVRFLYEMNHAGLKRTAEENFIRICKVTPEELAPKWRAFTLALNERQAPEVPVITGVRGNGAKHDIRTGDLICRVDGVRITSIKQYERLWKHRPGGRGMSLELRRRTPVEGEKLYEVRRVIVVIPTGDQIRLDTLAAQPMEANLTD